MPADVRLGLRTAVAFPFASNPGEKERLAGSPPEPEHDGLAGVAIGLGKGCRRHDAALGLVGDRRPPISARSVAHVGDRRLAAYAGWRRECL
jgi:hypothetical protein